MADTSSANVDPRKLREGLSSWDAKNDPKAPLTTLQKDLLIELISFASERPLPTELPLDDVPVTVLTSTSHAGKQEEETNPVQKYLISSQIENDGKIENAQQFFSWFAEVENDIVKEEDLPYKLVVVKYGEWNTVAILESMETDLSDSFSK